jgi:hypothetical protein
LSEQIANNPVLKIRRVLPIEIFRWVAAISREIHIAASCYHPVIERQAPSALDVQGVFSDFGGITANRGRRLSFSEVEHRHVYCTAAFPEAFAHQCGGGALYAFIHGSRIHLMLKNNNCRNQAISLTIRSMSEMVMLRKPFLDDAFKV